MAPDSHADRLQIRTEQRERLLVKLWDIDGPFHKRLVKCGQPLNLCCQSCMERRPVETRCKWKCCPVCQPGLVAASARRFTKIAKGCRWPLLVTFSAQHDVHDDVQAFREQRAALVRFRAQRWFKLRVKGGVCAWEVSRLSKRERRARKLGRDRGWHFHCHALIDCKWLWCSTPPPRQFASTAERNARIKVIADELNQLWSMALGARKGDIHIRRVWKDSNGGIDAAIHEVLKYALSGAELADSEYDIEPALWALEKTRMVSGFGSFYRHPDIKRERPAPAMCQCGCSAWIPEEFHEVNIAFKQLNERRRTGRKR